MSYEARDWVQAQRNAPKVVHKQPAEQISEKDAFDDSVQYLQAHYPELYAKALLILADRPRFFCKECGAEVVQTTWRSVGGTERRSWCDRRCKWRYLERAKRERRKAS